MPPSQLVCSELIIAIQTRHGIGLYVDTGFTSSGLYVERWPLERLIPHARNAHSFFLSAPAMAPRTVCGCQSSSIARLWESATTAKFVREGVDQGNSLQADSNKRLRRAG